MRIQFLGTSAAQPTKRRGLSAVAIQLDQRSDWHLVDCGEGTQHQLVQTAFATPRLRHLYITHVHGDHIFGLPGLISTRDFMNGAEQELIVHAPPGVEEFVKISLQTSTGGHMPKLQTRFVLYEGEEEIHREDGLSVRSVQLEHRVPSVAFVFQEDDSPGALLTEKLIEQGVRPGPIFAEIKAGKTVTLEDGRVLDGLDFLAPARPGRKLVVAGDNSNPGCFIEAARDADLLIHESSYLQVDQGNLKVDTGHSNVEDVCAAAKQAGVRNLILTHFSARYDKSRIHELGVAAEAAFGTCVHLAEDLATYRILSDKTLVAE